MMHARLLTTLIAVAAASCTHSPIVDAPSRNQNSRVNYLVMHFTTENFADSMALLTEASDNPVSAHYLIPEAHDRTYGQRPLRVFRLVPESRRAWHAGRSYWNGEEALNNRSIGIELVNRAYCVDDTPDDDVAENSFCVFPDFADEQITLLVKLARDILSRYPDIDATDIVAHADIAPERKVDPGPRFPWQRLYRAGIGAWYDDDTMLRYRQRFLDGMPPLRTMQQGLAAYGYRIEASGVDDEATRHVVRAFQMHFVPSAVSGKMDARTAAVLFALLEKYRPEQLRELAAGLQTPETKKPLE